MIKAKALSLLTRIKHGLARYFFADEVAKVDLERETFLKLQKEYKNKIDDFSKWTNKHTVVDAVRTQLKGFNPKLLDTEEDLPEILGEIEAQEGFLSKMETLHKMSEAWVLMDYLVRNQVLLTAKEAQTLDAINFGRATINGLELFRSEVARLATIHAERHAAKPKFDEFEVV